MGSEQENSRTLSRHSIRLIIAALGVLYRQAIEHGIVDRNPTEKLAKFYRRAPIRNEEIQP